MIRFTLLSSVRPEQREGSDRVIEPVDFASGRTDSEGQMTSVFA